ncbi:uncharacterized protein LOC112206368 isoform X2 [Pan troglodytes]|uniref:uncharacterized protein LOC112206368 isoform X2 n=1 Tax=Pan troglodytes TaxID=9598 RepID=UPI003013313E
MPVSGRWNAWQRKLARAQGAKKYNKGPTGRSNGPTPAGLELTRLQALGSQRLSAVKWRMFRTVEARSAPGLKAGDLATSARGCAGPCRWGLWRQTLPKARGGNSPDPPRVAWEDAASSRKLSSAFPSPGARRDFSVVA